MHLNIPLTYTRPKHVPSEKTLSRSLGSFDSMTSDVPPSSEGTEADKATASAGESLRSGTSSRIAGIPPALSFDKIVNGGTCPPCTVRDFMNFLLYVEHAAENLQFYLWFRDYEHRFAALTPGDQALASEWTQAHADEVFARMRRDGAEKRQRETPVAAQLFKGTDFERARPSRPAVSAAEDPFCTPPRTPASASFTDRVSVYTNSTRPPTTAATYRSQASEAFLAAGTRMPFTIQPFRAEIDRIISMYIMEGGARQLNLSAPERNATMQALSYTTHPSALRLAFKTIDASLRTQAHPNFIRWSICNGNRSRVWFARGLGVFLIVGSLVAATVLTLSSLPRGYRAIPSIGLVLGISTLIAAWKGMCVVLHGMHHRHVRPWELFDDVEDEMAMDDVEKGLGRRRSAQKDSFDSFGSSNSYEDEPWVVRYQKRNIIRKIFDRETWIEEPALRQIQDVIFLQAMAGALVASGALTALFVLLPAGNLF